MTQFMHLAEIVDGFGGSWSYEWPAFCLGWKLDPLKQWFGGRPSFHARFDGCRFGLTDRLCRPVKKPWVVMTSNRTLAASLDGSLCQCPRGAHAPCAGSVARSSENYTEALAQAAIHAIALQNAMNLMAPMLLPHFFPSVKVAMHLASTQVKKPLGAYHLEPLLFTTSATLFPMQRMAHVGLLCPSLPSVRLTLQMQ